MTERTAVILAAGRGIRMGARGRLMPKGMIPMGDSTLMQRSVALLQERGIGQVRIVTGHLQEQYVAAFAGQAGVTLVHNPDYATSGSLRSLVVGLDGVTGPVIVLESDLIYETAALAPLQREASVILVSGPTGSGDEVYVWTLPGRAGRVPAFGTMSKDPAYVSEPPLGELVGISLFDKSDTKALRGAAAATLARDPCAEYEEAIIALAASCEIACHRFDDLAWSEIDDDAMYRRARDVIWPEICRREG